jgi:2,3-bisphosphoglycerate-dependent phosphoglycerate mutase
MAKQYGDEQVLIWRRSYDTPPPALEPTTRAASAATAATRSCKPEEVPLTECLKDTVARVMPVLERVLAPAIRPASGWWWPPTATASGRW